MDWANRASMFTPPGTMASRVMMSSPLPRFVTVSTTSCHTETGPSTKEEPGSTRMAYTWPTPTLTSAKALTSMSALLVALIWTT